MATQAICPSTPPPPPTPVVTLGQDLRVFRKTCRFVERGGGFEKKVVHFRKMFRI
jgi:hypothetical protein